MLRDAKTVMSKFHNRWWHAILAGSRKKGTCRAVAWLAPSSGLGRSAGPLRITSRRTCMRGSGKPDPVGMIVVLAINVVAGAFDAMRFAGRWAAPHESWWTRG